MRILDKIMTVERIHGNLEWSIQKTPAGIPSLSKSVNENPIINTNELEISGWSFSTFGNEVFIDTYIDDNKTEQVKTDMERFDVVDAFPAFKVPIKSGFVCKVNLQDLKNGTHVLSVKSRCGEQEKLLGSVKFVLSRNIELMEDLKKIASLHLKSTINSNASIKDIVDELYLQYGSDVLATMNCPPRHIRGKIQSMEGIWEYASVSSQFSGFLKILCNLKSNHKILDIGCGSGRIAASLRGFFQKPGSYYGIDVNSELIEHAKMKISEPLFHFTSVNVYSHMYNRDPTATKPEELIFPYDDNFFEVISLTSVFTHMIPPSIENYVKEISRMLKPKGRCLITMFLFQNNPTYLKKDFVEKIPLSKTYEIKNNSYKSIFRVGDFNRPEEFVIFDFKYIHTLFNKNGMELIGEPYWGAWSGNPNYLAGQDVIIFEKK